VKHRITRRRLGRATDQRLALLHNLVTSLIWHGHVVTTVARAKEARSMAEKLITLAKEDTVHHRRLARRVLMPRTGLVRMRQGAHREVPAGGEAQSATQGGRSPASVENSIRRRSTRIVPADMLGSFAWVRAAGTASRRRSSSLSSTSPRSSSGANCVRGGQCRT
jgi:ribosomal protein L17